MTAPHLDLAARQGGAIARRQLTAGGVTPRRVAGMVARGELRAVRRNVFVVVGAPPTWAQRAWIELLDNPPSAALAGRTSARLHRIGRFTVDAVDVTQPEQVVHRPVQASRRRSTRLPPHHVVRIDGFPTTSLARTVFDLCGLVSDARRERGLSSLSRAQLERALDDAFIRGLTVAAADRILAEMGGRGRPGTVVMRELLEPRGQGYVATESELEDLLLLVIADGGLPPPVRQRVLGAERPIGRVDAVYLAERVVIEADGRRNHSALLDADADRWRDLELAAAGFVVIRVTWWQLVNEPERFVAALRKLLAARAAAA